MSVQPHPHQHYRLSVESAKRDYADGLITAAGLLYYCVGVLRKPGQHVAMPVKEWLRLTGLQERTFYKAKAKLIALGKLEERIIGSVELWMANSIAGRIGGDRIDCPTVQDCPTLQDCPTEQKPDDATVSADTCPIVQVDCPIVPDTCPIVQPHCPIVRNEPPKLSPNKTFSDPSNNSNISNKPATQKVAGAKSVTNKPNGKSEKEIPRDLRRKLEELRILTGHRDERVLRAIASRDLSQAYGAAAHVERTYESCSNPRSVFLFQLPRQPVEKLGALHPVRTADEFMLPLATLKQMYPAGVWREAAMAYGYSEEEIDAAAL